MYDIVRFINSTSQEAVDMKYEKLSKQALKCMYTAEIIGNVILLAVIGAVNYFWLIPKDIGIGKIISTVLAV